MTRWTSKAMGVGLAVIGLGGIPTFGQHGHEGDSHGHHKPAPTLPPCPVMGEPINLAVSVATDDGPVFFCCKGCIGKYKANSDKYAAKVALQRKALSGRPKTQVTCPVSGDKVDRKSYVEEQGRKVYFCCDGCAKKYARAPKKYAVALANSYTYQTTCPVMGEEINPKVFAKTASGLDVYFCCRGCEKRLFADPAKYASKMAEQGYVVGAKGLAAPQEHAHGTHDGHDHDH